MPQPLVHPPPPRADELVELEVAGRSGFRDSRWVRQMTFPGSGMALRGIGVAVTLAVLTACGSPSPSPASPAHVAATTGSAPSKPSSTTAPDAPATDTAMITVPDGVGLDYQSAQDEWRAAGLHVAPADDATGAHRLPLVDANWVVLSQNLKAGSKVAADSFITATVKKYSDG